MQNTGQSFLVLWRERCLSMPVTFGVLNINPYLAGGTFGKSFLSQIAADAGFGLRFNFTVLLLRTDFGIPIRQPNSAIPLRGFHDGVFNLAIGYPF